MPDLFTTKGDLAVATAADVAARQGVGANGGLLVANSAVVNGLQWSDTFAGIIYLNDTANAQMTAGLTLNQGGADNEILALKSSDVAHGITGLTETDTYGFLKKTGAVDGGLEIGSIAGTSSVTSLICTVAAGTADQTKSTTASAPVEVTVLKKSGAGFTTWAANDNLFIVQNSTTVRFIVDSDGDIFAIGGQVFANGDTGGVASMTALTNGSDETANSTGVGTIKFKGTTNRDSTGFIKIYVGTNARYLPVFDAITG